MISNMGDAEPTNLRDVLTTIVDRLEKVAATVAALERAAKDENLGGRQLTGKQVADLRTEEGAEMKSLFDDIRGLIAKVA